MMNSRASSSVHTAQSWRIWSACAFLVVPRAFRYRGALIASGLHSMASRWPPIRFQVQGGADCLRMAS